MVGFKASKTKDPFFFLVVCTNSMKVHQDIAKARCFVAAIMRCVSITQLINFQLFVLNIQASGLFHLVLAMKS